MKYIFLFLFLCLLNIAKSQSMYTSVPATKLTPQALSKMITINDTTDKQKVRSIFLWITNNIAYNTKIFSLNSSPSVNNYLNEQDDDSAAPLKSLNERVAEIVLKRGTAVCDGYARLFKTLCDYQHIPCEIITGFAKTHIGRNDSKFRSNHKWNAVFVDSAWHLLDLTWASGYINYRNEFERELDERYYFTDPKDFIADHYPEDMRWTLLQDLPVPPEYNSTPFKYTDFVTYYISDFSPASGIINATIGDSIIFTIQTTRPNKTLLVTDLRFVDSNMINLLKCCGAAKPVNTITGNKISYTYHVSNPDAAWLNIIYDDALIMRYKLYVHPHSDSTIVTP